jgi:LuxR family maltose regulon positive regulatory protein
VHGLVARPALVGRLEVPARVTVVSAPAGSGKTVLLRSWIDQGGLAPRVAWVSVGREERDPQRFWLAVLDAFQGTGSSPVRGITAAPDLDGWVVVERLLEDLARLPHRIWLVIDDLHELSSQEALRQLELLVLRAPSFLRFVFTTRHELRLGLHRLRLDGELAEIRASDLSFSVTETRELFELAGVELPERTLAVLHERTEGWAAGLRLAALCLVGQSDPERFAAEFSGAERVVAEYLLAEVLERQDERVRRLLLRTSVLERVNGELADLLTGGIGAERILQDLEQANVFVTALDATRSWFRYHHLFADLLRLELRRQAPSEITALHRACARWFAEHGHPVEAIRHAQAAQDWDLAADLLSDSWPGLFLDGRAAVRELLEGFPAEIRTARAELAALVAADELVSGSAVAAERYLVIAEHALAAEPSARLQQAQLLLGMVRLQAGRVRGDQAAVLDEVRRFRALADTSDAVRPDLGTDLHALALISLGVTEDWTDRLEEAERHLSRSVALARRIERPYLEFSALAYLAAVGMARSSFGSAAEHAEQVIELAGRHGWTEEPAAAISCAIVGARLAWQGRADEAEPWIQRAELRLRAEAEPAVGAGVRYVRGILELTRDRAGEALAAFQSAERLTGQLRLTSPHYLTVSTRVLRLHALVRLGRVTEAERILAGFDEQERGRAEMRIASATVLLARADPHAASSALKPVLDGSARPGRPTWSISALALEAVARDAMNEPDAAEDALERAFDLAEPEGAVWHFLLHPSPDLLARHARRRTAHASLIADILSLLAGRRRASSLTGPLPVLDPLSEGEIRVLRYLPTSLTASEIAGELGVSPNTVKTHIRNVYIKLGTHRRSEAVERARALGLLAPAADG